MFCFKVNKYIFTGGREIYARNPFKTTRFTYGACGPFTKNKERVKKFMQTGNTDFIYKMNLIKLFLAWYGLWKTKRFNKKNTVR